MKIEAYELTDARHLQQVSIDTPPRDWLDDQTPRWIRLYDCSKEEIRATIEPMNLHPLAVEGCLDTAAVPKVVVIDEVIFINYPIFQNDAEESTGYLRVVCLPTTLITISDTANSTVDRIVDNLTGDVATVAPGIGALLYHLLDEVFRANGPATMALRDRIKREMENLKQDQDSVEPAELMALGTDTDDLIAAVENQMYCAGLLHTSKSRVLEAENTRAYFRDLAAEIGTADQFLNRLERRVRDLKQMRAMGVDERTSKRLRVLTILTAIYMPPTLIAAIYGMNFEDIPIQNIPYGYFVVVLIMVAIVVGQIVFFTRRGWFN